MQSAFRPSTNENTSCNNTFESEGITVCICTYQREKLLERLLTALSNQRTEDLFRFTAVVVVDNDASGSARDLIERLRAMYPVPIRYLQEPAKNIALARNRALSQVSSKYFAFIDDDETPGEDWLLNLWRTLNHYNADAALGPVRPYFEDPLPAWIERSRICERPSHTTGTALHWTQTRTGNVLLRTAIVTRDGIQFDPSFGSGGEDIDFFRRAAISGKKFIWSEESAVYELVPASRLTRRYYLKRALLQGQISFKYANDRPSFAGMMGVTLKTVAAALIYTVALPILFLFGDHVGMKYLIKDCHHIARLFAILGISRSARRTF